MRSRTMFLALVALALAVLAVFGAAASQGGVADPGDRGVARYVLTIDGVEVAAFGELGGIRSGYEPTALELAARRLSVPGKRTPPTVILKRGLSNAMEIQAWHDQALESVEAARRNTTLTMFDVEGKPVFRYHLENAWPAKLEIGALKAGASEVLIETVTIVAERLERVSP